MFNKNDPLIDSVKKVMEQNNKERDAIKAVNEKFGVQSRKALPHEKQGEWDAAYAKVLAEGVETLNESKIPGYISGQGKFKAQPEPSDKEARKQWGLPAKKKSKKKVVKEETDTKAKKLKLILQRRFGKGDGKESVSQSRREDK